MSTFFHVLACDDGGDELGMPDEPVLAEPYATGQSASLAHDIPLLATWRPMTAEFFRDEGEVELDFYPFDSHLVATKRTFPILSEQNNIELLPLGHIVSLPGYCNRELLMAHVVHCRDRLALEAGSKYSCFPDTDSIMQIKRAVVAKERVSGAQLFKFARNPVSLYCTELFRSVVAENSLRGLFFEETDFEIVLR